VIGVTRSINVFVIEDGLGVSDNLNAFSQVLEGLDTSLGAALRPYLTAIAAGHPVDTSTIWDALYAASVSDLDRADGSASGVA
jgi:hypothetical protein